MLHILNGDSLADALRPLQLPGDYFVWREVLMEGPTPAGLSLARWRAVRAAFLARHYGAAAEDAEAWWEDAERALQDSLREDEVVLWFEQDLFCMVNLLYVMAAYARPAGLPEAGRRGPAVSANLPAPEPGVWPRLTLVTARKLGAKTPPKLLSRWFERRLPITAAHLQEAARIWNAYTAPAPDTVKALAARTRFHIPGLGPALRAHAERFPAPATGLGLPEQTVLRLLVDGPLTFGQLFARFVKQLPVYGMGDAQVLQLVKGLARPPSSLVVPRPLRGLASPEPEAAAGVRLSLTDAGAGVLEGRFNAIALRSTDHWLGGVHVRQRREATKSDASNLTSG